MRVITQARSCTSTWLLLCVCEVTGASEKDFEHVCQQYVLGYAHTNRKQILLSIYSDLYFLCHVKTVTGVSPKAKTVYHCLPLYLTVFIYCCSSLEESGNITVHSVLGLHVWRAQHCQPCSCAWQCSFIKGLTTWHCLAWTSSRWYTCAGLDGRTEGQDMP